MKKNLIKYFKSLGIEVNTNTKARGHQGFFLENRIDISKETEESRIVPTLLHEFAHFIHKKIEPDMSSTGGSISILFNLSDNIEKVNESSQDSFEKAIFGNFFGSFFKNAAQNRKSTKSERLKPAQSKEVLTIQKELLDVTHYVDKNSKLTQFVERKEKIKSKIKDLEIEIKVVYPDFMRSKKFKEFDKYIKKSKAKYLLKYDRVKFLTPFLGQEKFYSIDTIDSDFPDMPAEFANYIRLKSLVRKQSRISKRVNRLKKYYLKPTELFARFVEGLYIDEAQVRALAPHSSEIFFDLLEKGYYFELAQALNITGKDLIFVT